LPGEEEGLCPACAGRRAQPPLRADAGSLERWLDLNA
jgi:hypothetical protein